MSSLTPERLNELEQLAKAAAEHYPVDGYPNLPAVGALAEFRREVPPATVLALLSEVRALRESVKAYREWREAFIDYGLAELTESGPTLQQAERLAKAEPALSPSSTAKEPQ